MLGALHLSAGWAVGLTRRSSDLSGDPLAGAGTMMRPRHIDENNAQIREAADPMMRGSCFLLRRMRADNIGSNFGVVEVGWESFPRLRSEPGNDNMIGGRMKRRRAALALRPSRQQD